MNKAGITSRGEGRYALTGELTFGTVPELWRSSSGTFANDTAVRLDLAGISRVDSAGIAMLIELTRLVRNRGGKISLEHAPPQLRFIGATFGPSWFGGFVTRAPQ